MKTASKNENKFAAILQARQGSAMEEQEPAPPVTVDVTAPTTPPVASSRLDSPLPARKRQQPIIPVNPTTATTTEELPKRFGRPAGQGKSSDPNFRQVTIYIPRELHNNATIALRLANQTRIDADKEDFSDMLTQLLANWYEKQRYYHPDA
jgi:hypothetical protein